VEGRTHSVQVHHLEAPAPDYVRAAVEAAVAVHMEDLPGDILIFLTGQDECEAGEQRHAWFTGAAGAAQLPGGLLQHAGGRAEEVAWAGAASLTWRGPNVGLLVA
jgi:hypothetical protein